MEQRQKQIAGGVGALLLCACAGWAINDQVEANEQAEQSVLDLKTEIAAGRRLVETTPEKERQVIVLRELDPVFAEILPRFCVAGAWVHWGHHAQQQLQPCLS